jgi:hypothetical protein
MKTPMNTRATIARALMIITATAWAAPRAEAASISTYISLGDSIAYGSGTTQDSAPGSGAGQGFVSQFASTLGQADGGVTPNVFNLALPNETLGTFSTGNANSAANTSYSSSQGTQSGMFLHDMASELAAGHQITNMTISLGTSDIANILNSPGFSSLSLADQAAKLQAGLTQVQTQFTALMSEVRNVLPNTKIDLIGAYNPYHATPNDPLAPIAEPAFLGLNKIIQGEAKMFGASYVDTYTAFLGHEGTFTNILGGQGNTNPTAAGFSAIADQLAQATPEPSTLFLAGVGLAGLAARSCRRRYGKVA